MGERTRTLTKLTAGFAGILGADWEFIKISSDRAYHYWSLTSLWNTVVDQGTYNFKTGQFVQKVIEIAPQGIEIPLDILGLITIVAVGKWVTEKAVIPAARKLRRTSPATE